MINSSEEKRTNNIYNDKYVKIEKCGMGAFGKVIKTKDINNENQYYAVKIFYLDNLKNEKTNIIKRQLDILNSLSHNNIIKAIESFNHRGNECIAFDYHEIDLLKIINNKNINIDENLIRAVIKQILEGTNFLHEKGILHRDLKPDNILISREGTIKIADFDLSRVLSTENSEPLSRGVVTIYYRPPEVFYGDTNYDYSLDMWSIGCILAEMLLREPIFKGRSELDVMYKIYEVLSSANEDNWPGCTKLPNYFTFGDSKPIRPLSDMCQGKISESCYDLLCNLLNLDPKKRLTAKEALNHEFFSKDKVENFEEIIKKIIN